MNGVTSIKTILVLGAGRSSSALIQYLLQKAAAYHWKILVGDSAEEAALDKIGDSPHAKAIRFNIHDEQDSKKIIESSTVVISLLPAHLHPLVAKLCLALKKHFLNASYVSDEMKILHREAKTNDLLFLNECGLDPGIDHMSAMQVIDKIKSLGGKLTSFESFTGGLISQGTDKGNPWRYKFTWNPRNVILAGQGTAKFLLRGNYKYVPYQQLFKRTTSITVLGETYEGYPNRDSLKYLTTYGLRDVETMVRGTLRQAGFCKAWDVFVQLGCCDDSYLMEGVANMTHRDFIDSFLAHHIASTEDRLSATLGLHQGDDVMHKLRWIGIFSSDKIGLDKGTPAQILEHILNKKWKLVPGDKDLIVMWHRFKFELNGTVKEIQSHLSVAGDNEIETAMAKTVGLPLAVAAKLLLEGKIKARGVVIPVEKEIYDPVLKELHALGIRMTETETTIDS